VIAQVVIGVADEDREGDSSPQLPQVFAGACGMALDDLGDVEIAALLRATRARASR
jgi:hypothetical protein